MNGLRKLNIFKSCIIFIFCCCFCLSANAQEKKKILIINSYHQGLSWTDNILQGIKKSLKPEEEHIDFYIEYMDTKRFYGERYFEKFFNFMKQKYNGIKFDLIVVSDNDALLFIGKYYQQLFYRTPVIFCGVNDFSDKLIEKHRNGSQELLKRQILREPLILHLNFIVILREFILLMI